MKARGRCWCSGSDHHRGRQEGLEPLAVNVTSEFYCVIHHDVDFPLPCSGISLSCIISRYSNNDLINGLPISLGKRN